MNPLFVNLTGYRGSVLMFGVAGLLGCSVADAQTIAAVSAAGPVSVSPPAYGAQVSLPPPSGTPQRITRAGDVFLTALGERRATEEFIIRVQAAAEALPVLGERGQDVAAAQAARDQARSGLFPRLGIDAVSAGTVARDFAGDQTLVERLVPRSRNDVTGSVEQIIADFGATGARIRSGNAGTEAARADLDAARNTALLQLVSAWYDVLSARTAVQLSAANVLRLDELAKGAALRFEGGIDSGGDVARARSYLAASQSQQVNFQRRLASAEARYAEVFGVPAGPLFRPVAPEGLAALGIERPEVTSAKAQEREIAAAVDAAKSDRLPRIDARIGGTAYDVVSGNRPDYDVRAQVTLRQRFSTGGAEAARVAELKARRRAAGLAVDRISAVATREQATAEADVAGLADILPPLESSYLDSRRARDLFVEQFRVSRGTLFDVLRAERDLLDTALALAQTNYELDVARFTLLARQGGLIERFGLTPAVAEDLGQERDGNR